ncbi:MAG: zf-HC2 domain-containing protein [Anaerolineae bacterium]|nr:zf-HC2 domain-containing protein [Anaerolineae bacterium]
MQCHKASEWMSLQLDGLLSPKEALALEQHVETCDDCWLEWQQLRAVSVLFEQVALEPAPAEFTAQVMARVRRRSRWLSFVRGVALMLLGLAILLAVAWAPLAALSGIFSESPAVLRALVSLVTSVANLVGTFFSAIRLVLWSLFGGYGGLVLAGCVVLVMLLAVPWVKLVARASALHMQMGVRGGA